MNPDFWLKPYDWSFEKKEILASFIKLFEAYDQAKRIKIDPFQNKLQIRCTYKGCVERYDAPDNLVNVFSTKEFQTAFVIASIEHQHFYKDLGFSFDGVLAIRIFSNGKKYALCINCFKSSPVGTSVSTVWNHDCASDKWGFGFDRMASNTLFWKSSSWVLDIDFEYSLWQFLSSPSINCLFDPTSNKWIVADGTEDRIKNACINRLPTFRFIPKPKIFQGRAGGRNLSPAGAKTILAGHILNQIPPQYLPKVRKAIQSALHPDRDPEDKENLTKAFQAFEESWRKWEGK